MNYAAGRLIKASRRGLRQLKRFVRRKKTRNLLLYMASIAAVVIFVSGLTRERIPEMNYTHLLSTIAEGESKGNYNAYFGHAGNTEINFTAMSVGEVLQWQNQYVEQGSPSSAVGKYQFMETTLRGLIGELGVNENEIFNEALQDRLAIRLLERRGVHDYMRGRISREQLAHNLSKEWAALPRVIGDDPTASYYAGDGLNHVRVSIDEVFAAIESLHDLNSAS